MNAKDLQKAFAKLPHNEGDRPTPHTWARYLWDIRRHVKKQDPDEFLTWSTIHATMFVGSGAKFTPVELKALRADDWDRWKVAIADPGFGDPPFYPDEDFTTGNMIHQGYHMMQFEQMAGVEVQELDRIVEFGGGYGSLANIVRKLGFLGEYVIYDNPEMSLIQQFYLSNIDVEADFSVTNGHTFEPPGAADLLFGAYSLSEVPDELRNDWLEQTDFRYYFIVHQDRYWENDLREVFDEFAETRPDKEWVDRKSPIRGHRYLIGKPID